MTKRHDYLFHHLGASPLRLYGPDSIVNVQCPVKAFRKTIDEAINRNLLPLTYKDGDINVKDNSNWYIEVQGQLHITGPLERTHFFVRFFDRIFQEENFVGWWCG